MQRRREKSKKAGKDERAAENTEQADADASTVDCDLEDAEFSNEAISDSKGSDSEGSKESEDVDERAATTATVEPTESQEQAEPQGTEST